MAEEPKLTNSLFAEILSREYKTVLFRCEKHGEVECEYYIDKNGQTVWGECPECAKEHEEMLAEKERLAEIEKQKERWLQSNIKDKFFDMTFDDYKVFITFLAINNEFGVIYQERKIDISRAVIRMIGVAVRSRCDLEHIEIGAIITENIFNGLCGSIIFLDNRLVALVKVSDHFVRTEALTGIE